VGQPVLKRNGSRQTRATSGKRSRRSSCAPSETSTSRPQLQTNRVLQFAIGELILAVTAMRVFGYRTRRRRSTADRSSAS